MQKSFAFASIALTSSAIVLGVVACSDAEESTFADVDHETGVVDSGPSFNTGDASNSSSNAEGGSIECPPSLSALFEPTWRPPTKAAVCDAAELTAYYDTCVRASGKADAGADCTTWKQDHATCAACLEPVDNNGPVQFYQRRLYYGLNVAGCLAITRDEMEDGKCPSAYSATIQCQRESCDACLLQRGAQYSDFQKCQQSARATGCKTYEENVRKACEAGFTGPDGGSYTCFRPSGEDERTHFVRVEGLFCGK